jgi:DNA-binding HxlR family transcriptional regulator
MKINDDTLDRILQVIASKNNMLILNMIPKDSCLGYLELKTKFNKIRNTPDKENTFSYHLRVLKKLGLLRKDEKRVYFLTRIGIRTLEVVDNFKNICMEYDISDLDADGKIVLTVKGRKI